MSEYLKGITRTLIYLLREIPDPYLFYRDNIVSIIIGAAGGLLILIHLEFNVLHETPLSDSPLLIITSIIFSWIIGGIGLALLVKLAMKIFNYMKESIYTFAFGAEGKKKKNEEAIDISLPEKIVVEDGEFSNEVLSRLEKDNV